VKPNNYELYDVMGFYFNVWDCALQRLPRCRPECGDDFKKERKTVEKTKSN
jgi:hypothetical protein